MGDQADSVHGILTISTVISQLSPMMKRIFSKNMNSVTITMAKAKKITLIQYRLMNTKVISELEGQMILKTVSYYLPTHIRLTRSHCNRARTIQAMVTI